MEKKTTSAIIADECLAVRVRLLDRYVTKLYNDALRPFDLKITQLNILTVIDLCNETGPQEVCKRLQLEKSTVSRNIDRMRQRGWLSVEKSGSRSQVLTVTKRGKELIELAEPEWKKAQVMVSGLLGESGTWAINSLADIVWNNEDKN